MDEAEASSRNICFLSGSVTHLGSRLVDFYAGKRYTRSWTHEAQPRLQL